MGHKSKRFKKTTDVQIQITDFKSSFKHFKRRDPPPDFDKVVDLQDAKFNQCFGKVLSQQSDLVIENANDVTQWSINKLLSNPGITIIQNVFSSSHLKYWASRCIKDFSGKSYKRNIDHPDLNLKIENWFDAASSAEPGVVDKLRWATLGYHHDWDTKVYSEDDRGKFPDDLANLSAGIVKALGGDTLYRAEAAIVNYYPANSCLSGHTDHSEINLGAPLVSISLGLPAIFLIGGPSLDTVPSPLLLRSGDVLVMEREARLCYHAVPRILPREANTEETGTSTSEKFIETYLSSHRINMNIRQVH